MLCTPAHSVLAVQPSSRLPESRAGPKPTQSSQGHAPKELRLLLPAVPAPHATPCHPMPSHPSIPPVALWYLGCPPVPRWLLVAPGGHPCPATPGPAAPSRCPRCPRCPQHGQLLAVHRQEVAAEVEGRLFMLFFLYKSGRGWTIPDRTSCVCCELITAPRGEQTRPPRGGEGHGAGPPRRAHHGGEAATSPWGHGEGQGCWPRLPPEPHTRPEMGGTHPTPPHPSRAHFGSSHSHSPSKGTPTAPGTCAKHGRVGGHLLKRGHVSVDCHWSTFWGICDPLKSGVQGCAQVIVILPHCAWLGKERGAWLGPPNLQDIT